MIYALLNALILLALSLLHFYWAFGGRWGMNAALPERDGVKVLHPHMVDSLIVAIGLAGFAALHLYHMGWLRMNLPGWLAQYGLWAVGGIFLLRVVGDFRYVGLFKRIRNSQFAYWDTRLYVPLCLILSLNAFLLATSPRPLSATTDRLERERGDLPKSNYAQGNYHY